MTKIPIFIVVIIILSSCSDRGTIFSEYKSIHKNKWHKDSIISFNVDIEDTISTNIVYINLRNDKDYAFNNIFLIASINYPNQTKIIDTLEYKMADEKGYFLGTGFTDIKENKLIFKEKIIFPTKGVYKFSVQQAVRKNEEKHGIDFLEGVTDVGIKIKKINYDS